MSAAIPISFRYSAAVIQLESGETRQGPWFKEHGIVWPIFRADPDAWLKLGERLLYVVHMTLKREQRSD